MNLKAQVNLKEISCWTHKTLGFIYYN